MGRISRVGTGDLVGAAPDRGWRVCELAAPDRVAHELQGAGAAAAWQAMEMLVWCPSSSAPMSGAPIARSWPSKSNSPISCPVVVPRSIVPAEVSCWWKSPPRSKNRRCRLIRCRSAGTGVRDDVVAVALAVVVRVIQSDRIG